MPDPNKELERDIKAVRRLLDRHEGAIDALQKSARQLHGFLDRMGERYGPQMGVEVASVIPKDPD